MPVNNKKPAPAKKAGGKNTGRPKTPGNYPDQIPNKEANPSPKEKPGLNRR